MPFTISHTVAVLPLFRKKLSWSALAIGSMVPDLPLFLDAGRYSVSHSILGLITYDLPAGLMFWAIWSFIMREPSRLLCPKPLRANLFDNHPSRLSKVRIIMSILIGSGTHIFWDSFTHLNALGPQLIPGLLFGIANIPVYKWLQLISSVAGLVVLLHWLYKQWDNGAERNSIESLWIIAGWLVHGCCCIGFALIGSRFTDTSYYLYGMIIMSIQLFFSTWFLVCALYHSKSILVKTEDTYRAME